MITIKDVARETGFGVATVSKALNNYSDISQKTKELIRAKAKEMGYIPNASGRSLVTKSTFTIGLIFEERTNLGLTHPFFSEILEKIKKALEEKNYDILLISKKIGSYVETYLEHCIQKAVDGVIVVTRLIDNLQFEKLYNSDLPIVYVDLDTDKTCVFTDNYQSIVDAVEYLYKRGHREIGIIQGATTYNPGYDRYRAYRDTMNRLGLKMNPQHILYCKDYQIENAVNEIDKMYKNKIKLPTAFVTTGDMMAIGAIQAVQKNGGRVPEDVSIIGFDNILLSSHILPKLTTIAQNYELIAKTAVQLLLNLIRNPEMEPKRVVIPSKIIERDSVCDINNR